MDEQKVLIERMEKELDGLLKELDMKSCEIALYDYLLELKKAGVKEVTLRL